MKTRCKCSRVTQVSVSGKFVPKVVGSKKCSLCNGYGYTIPCILCSGCGIVNSRICYNCNGCGKVGVPS